MIDLKRLNELHAATSDGMCQSSEKWEIAITAAWPAVAARLELLEEFARRVRDPMSNWWTAVEWLDAETKKAGE